MNSLGQPLKLKANYKVLGILGAISLLLFLIVQVFPNTSSDTLEQKSKELITKEQARASATQYAESQLDLHELSSPNSLVTYQSHSELYGYLAKEKLVEYYNDTFEDKYPYDVYRVRLEESDSERIFNIDVHMNSGDVVAFSQDTSTNNFNSMNPRNQEALAKLWLSQLGYEPSQFQIVESSDSKIIFTDSNTMIGKAALQFEFIFDSEQILSFQPSFSVPVEHASYVKGEQNKALWMTILGYGLLTLVLGVLAIVYSALTRKHTSFVRGIFLSSFYFIVSMLSTINMIPTFEAEGMTQASLIFILIFQGVFTLFMSALLYFSLVGGDGLWRKEAGLNPWPRFKEAGYGKYVLNSMQIGYLCAFILLGVQSIIYFTLDLTIHTWSTTDASQSPLNMFYPWMLPLLAWVAGISEEAVYRLFGIPMMKKLVKNTFVACLIPSIIWAFGHTLYPIYPVISRPIELIIIGLIFSFIFLRYGYIAAMFSHVVFNSILMGFSLFTLGDVANISAGIIAMIVPVLVAYTIYFFHSIKKEKPSVTTPPEALQ
ncbi:CPBP family intramembrane glutamic endopeptidase [Paenibacillus crassostreae]|uniref:Abortive phage infection protein n=1 Tax=Paenibacillus crassostreae TaxID=1763538 RepID=A0A167GQ79_9BACL|nr:type II CAAX endopeptidase family protein [Paenibacillus crassostreae]AOZ91990.1 abortive phage infection protein [Paenibacillus crassostreae]OAB77797.1 abortive phage infection protein [Paenibacillus crassostreae]